MPDRSFPVRTDQQGHYIKADDGERRIFGFQPDGVYLGDTKVPPLLCENCKTLFVVKPGNGQVTIEGWVQIDDAGVPNFSGFRLGPCPHCRHGKGRVRDSLISRAASGVAAMKEMSDEELRALQNKLTHLKSATSDPAAFGEAVDADPSLQEAVGGALKEPLTRSELWGLLQFIIAAIGLILMLRGGGSGDTVTNNVTNNVTVTTIVEQVNEPDARLSNVGRNAPCPCGSGVKYKRCHGQPDEATAATPPTAPSENPTQAGSATTPPTPPREP